MYTHKLSQFGGGGQDLSAGKYMYEKCNKIPHDVCPKNILPQFFGGGVKCPCTRSSTPMKCTLVCCACICCREFLEPGSVREEFGALFSAVSTHVTEDTNGSSIFTK